MGKTVLDFQDHKITLKKTIMWLFVWTILLIIVIMPEIMSIPAVILGIKRSTDVFVYLGIMILFYALFLLSNQLNKQSKEIKKLKRRITIIRAETEAIIIENASNKIKRTINKKKTKKRKTIKKKSKNKKK
jgi:hypothetical protein